MRVFNAVCKVVYLARDIRLLGNPFNPFGELCMAKNLKAVLDFLQYGVKFSCVCVCNFYWVFKDACHSMSLAAHRKRVFFSASSKKKQWPSFAWDWKQNYNNIIKAGFGLGQVRVQCRIIIGGTIEESFFY